MKTFIVKSLLLATFTAMFAFAVPTYAADSAKDPVSGLPLLPSMHPENSPIDLTICGKQGQANQYFARISTASAIEWYKAHLRGIPAVSRLLGLTAHKIRSGVRTARKASTSPERRRVIKLSLSCICR